MNKRELRKALRSYQPESESFGRTIAILLSISSTPVPRPLRMHLQEAATACLRCETYDHAPEDAPLFSAFDAARSQAFTILGDAAYAHYTRRRAEPVQDEAANG